MSGYSSGVDFGGFSRDLFIVPGQTNRNATETLFKGAPKDVKRLQAQASKERRLKARAQWWANNSYRFPQKP